MFVLDTDNLSLLEQAGDLGGARLRARLLRLAPEDSATTIISFEEQMRGWMTYLARAKSPPQEVEAYRRLKRHIEIYKRITVLEFDEQAAMEYQRLTKARIRVKKMDLKIAAVTLTHGATLLSRNLKDFTKVPGLHVEDWTV